MIHGDSGRLVLQNMAKGPVSEANLWKHVMLAKCCHGKVTDTAIFNTQKCAEKDRTQRSFPPSSGLHVETLVVRPCETTWTRNPLNRGRVGSLPSKHSTQGKPVQRARIIRSVPLSSKTRILQSCSKCQASNVYKLFNIQFCHSVSRCKSDTQRQPNPTEPSRPTSGTMSQSTPLNRWLFRGAVTWMGPSATNQHRCGPPPEPGAELDEAKHDGWSLFR